MTAVFVLPQIAQIRTTADTENTEAVACGATTKVHESPSGHEKNGVCL